MVVWKIVDCYGFEKSSDFSNAQDHGKKVLTDVFFFLVPVHRTSKIPSRSLELNKQPLCLWTCGSFEWQVTTLNKMLPHGHGYIPYASSQASLSYDSYFLYPLWFNATALKFQVIRSSLDYSSSCCTEYNSGDARFFNREWYENFVTDWGYCVFRAF